tara:strand:+ start:1620 stop:1751 length:132 start_codon:yes stop_codon:yes gene_type:complete
MSNNQNEKHDNKSIKKESEDWASRKAEQLKTKRKRILGIIASG